MSEQDKLTDLVANAEFYRALLAEMKKVRKQPGIAAEIQALYLGVDVADVSTADTAGEKPSRPFEIDGSRVWDDSVTVTTFRPVFEKYILSQLPYPACMTFDDFAEILGRYAFGRADAELESSIQQLQAVWMYVSRSGYDRPFYFFHTYELEFEFGEWEEPDRSAHRMEDYVDDANTYKVWNSNIGDRGFNLELREFRDGKPENSFECKLFLGANCTEAAWQEVCPRFEELIPSVLRSLAMMESKLLRSPTQPQPQTGAEQAEKELQKCRCSFLKRRGLPLLTECIDSYFLPAEKKTHNLQQRLRNAVHLLVAADQQQMPAIAMSLSFSAIESLVCNNTQSIVDELSRNVATLLEPDRMNRQETIKSIKKLYNLRSKAMHGDRLTDDVEPRDQVRLLAAAVFTAILDWQAYQKRVGDTAERGDFLKELEAAQVSGSAFIGPNERLVGCLPGAP